MWIFPQTPPKILTISPNFTQDWLKDNSFIHRKKNFNSLHLKNHRKTNNIWPYPCIDRHYPYVEIFPLIGMVQNYSVFCRDIMV